jgi:hypothetical protein
MELFFNVSKRKVGKLVIYEALSNMLSTARWRMYHQSKSEQSPTTYSVPIPCQGFLKPSKPSQQLRLVHWPLPIALKGVRVASFLMARCMISCHLTVARAFSKTVQEVRADVGIVVTIVAIATELAVGVGRAVTAVPSLLDQAVFWRWCGCCVVHETAIEEFPSQPATLVKRPPYFLDL